MGNKCNLGVSYLGTVRKKPYLYVIEGTEVIPIAQLKVSEGEFWKRLGKALNIIFAGPGGILDMTEHIEQFGIRRTP
jgi:hypothetical protein